MYDLKGFMSDGHEIQYSPNFLFSGTSGIYQKYLKEFKKKIKLCETHFKFEVDSCMAQCTELRIAF